jgi:predicted secreted protein
MILNDQVNFVGVFSIKAFNADGTVDEYTEKNLIMDEARRNMAQLVGGVTTAGVVQGMHINQFVLGTKGHTGTNILDYIKVGDAGFTSARTSLFSEAIAGAKNYRISFTPTGGVDVTDANATGRMYSGAVAGAIDGTKNTVRRVVSDRTVTYTITVPATNANSGDAANPVVAYTEAALYAGDEIFSMKTFPARVKEDTVKFEITWSIIF